MSAIDGRIRVGAVGVRPGEASGLLTELPDGLFEAVAFSDEGLEPSGGAGFKLTHRPDFNNLLEDEGIDLVLVDGPVELRGDFTARALSAGKHVVTARPFADTFADAYRMARKARQADRIVTCQMPARLDGLFRKVRGGVGADAVGEVFAVEHRVWLPEPLEAGAKEGLLVKHGVDLLDQTLLVLGTEVRDVRTFVRERREEVDWHFRVELSLRNGGWAVTEMMAGAPTAPPRWTVLGETGCLRSEGERLIRWAPDGGEEGGAEFPQIDFWQNVHGAVTSGVPLENTARQIVRAFRVWEAALESIGEPGPVSV
jgi:predicted dehydrogenase